MLAIVAMAGIRENEVRQRACRFARVRITFHHRLMALGFMSFSGVQHMAAYEIGIMAS